MEIIICKTDLVMNKVFFAALALALSFGSYAARPYQNIDPYYQRATLSEALDVDSDDIVFLGDRITSGCEWHELFGMLNVKKRGISSFVWHGGLDPVLKGAPKKIFLQIEADDFARDVSADSIATAIANYVDYIHENSPASRLYVQSMLPSNESYDLFKGIVVDNLTVRQANLLLEGLAGEKDFVWLDVFDLFVDEDGNLDSRYTNDGLRLMGEAYRKLRDFLLPYVTE